MIAGGGQIPVAIAARPRVEGDGPAISVAAGALINGAGIVMPTERACALFYGDVANNTTTGVSQ